LVAIVRPGLDGVILPKVESTAGLATVDWLLAQLERDRGLPPGGIDLIPNIETARGLDRLGAILAAGTRVRRVAFGAGDFTLDVNMAWSRDEAELAHARATIVTASRAAGIEAPLDTVWVDLPDRDGLEASARTASGFGFQGKMCILSAPIGSPCRQCQVSSLRRQTTALRHGNRRLGQWEGTTNVAIHPRPNKVEFGATAPEVVGQHD
jgi:citrate lyase beta subunit